MSQHLGFVIPVRHHLNAKSWTQTREYLEQTVKSVAAQTSPLWKCFVVANEGSDLPSLPPSISVVRVDFPPNETHGFTSESELKTSQDAVRLDKGKRVLAGLREAVKHCSHAMVLDDDDFVSRHLAEFIGKDRTANGYTIQRGYKWVTGSKWIFEEPYFPTVCGSSHIVRSDLYGIDRATSDDEYVKAVLGSHRHVEQYFQSIGSPLSELPFRGAIYRVGHLNSHSASVDNILVNRHTLSQPSRLFKLAMRMKRKNKFINAEFFGETTASARKSIPIFGPML